MSLRELLAVQAGAEQKQMLQMKKHQRRQKQTLKRTLQRKKLQERISEEAG